MENDNLQMKQEENQQDAIQQESKGFPTFKDDEKETSNLNEKQSEKSKNKKRNKRPNTQQLKEADDSEQQPLTEEEQKAIRRKIRQSKRRSLIMAMLILVAVVAGMAIWGILHLKPSDTTVQGQADCEVVRISGKLAGRLVELYVKEVVPIAGGISIVGIEIRRWYEV